MDMKKTLAIAGIVASLTAFGAWEKVATVRLADVDTLVKGATRIGGFTGNQMLGLMFSPLIAQMPPVVFFGPGRPGVAMSYVVSAEGDAIEKGTPLDEALDYAVLYPISVTRDAFLASHSRTVVTNGLFCVRGEADDDDDSENAPLGEAEAVYVAFSADGKWASMSANPKLVKGALGEIKAAEEKMGGDLAKVKIAPKGWEAIARAVEAAAKAKDAKAKGAKKVDRKQLRDCASLVRQIQSLAVGLRVNERGVDCRLSTRFAKESDLSKIGRKALAPDAANALPKDAVCATLAAEDSGTRFVDYKSIATVLKKHGIDLSFLTLTEPLPNYSVFTLDLRKLLDAEETVSNVCKKVNVPKLAADLGKIKGDESLVVTKCPASGAALVVKGVKPAMNPMALFEATLPEAKGQPLNACGVFSYYAIIRAGIRICAPKMLAKMKPQEKAAVESLLMLFPPDGKGCAAYASWVKNERAHAILRVNAEEIKGLAACFSTFAAIQMQRKMKNAKNAKKAK